jgi:hypothetical protein
MPEQALVALQHLPEQQATQEQAIDLRFHLRNALLPLGEHQRMFDHLRAAETLAEALHDQRRLGQANAPTSRSSTFSPLARGRIIGRIGGSRSAQSVARSVGAELPRARSSQRWSSSAILPWGFTPSGCSPLWELSRGRAHSDSPFPPESGYQTDHTPYSFWQRRSAHRADTRRYS